MADIKYYMEFRDHYDRVVVVRFLVFSYILPPTQLLAGQNPVVISSQGDDEGIFQPVFTRKATMAIILQDDSMPFLDDIAVMDEDTFGVEIRINGGVEFVGWLVPDEQSRTFSYHSQTITLTAVDVISRLKERSLFNPTGSYTTVKQR